LQVGQFPWLHRFLLGNRLVEKLLLGNNALNGAALDLAQAQVAKFRERADEDTEKHSTFVHRLLEQQRKHPESITDRELNTHAFGNITAGADTTTIAMRTIVFHVLKNPEVPHSMSGDPRGGEVDSSGFISSCE
jgi:cytochrome P450